MGKVGHYYHIYKVKWHLLYLYYQYYGKWGLVEADEVPHPCQGPLSKIDLTPYPSFEIQPPSLEVQLVHTYGK